MSAKRSASSAPTGEQDDYPAPLTPLDCDLRGYSFMPLFGHRLFNSALYAKASAAEFKTALRLWWAAWNQCPAASLPDDDQALCLLADYGRDLRRWHVVRTRALHGFIRCADGRLYHPFLAEEAIKAHGHRSRNEAKRASDRGRLRKWRDERRAAAPSETLDETRFDTRSETLDVAGDRDRDRDKKHSVQARAAGRGMELVEAPRDDEQAFNMLPDLVPTVDARPALKDAAPETDRSRLFREGRRLLAKHDIPEAQHGPFLGKLLKKSGDDVPAVLTAIKEALATPPADVRPWLLTHVGRRPGPMKATVVMPSCNDRPEAWASIAERVGPDPDEPAGSAHAWVNGWAVDLVATQIVDAAGLAQSWRGDFRPVCEWLREGLDPDRDILPAIRRVARRPGYEPPRSLRFFSDAVRDRARLSVVNA